MHEVVNGANGSVTWCNGPIFCQRCREDEERTAYWVKYPIAATIVMPPSQYSVTYNGRA